MFWTIIIGMLLLSVFGFWCLQQDKEKKNLIIDMLKESEGFSPGYTILKMGIGNTSPRGVSFDESKEKVALICDGRIKIKSFDDIISCEAIVDGESVTKTSRGSQIVGAVIGGVLFGGVGALMGALTGTKKHIEKIKSVSVKLRINDLNEPSIVIPFIESTAAGKTPPTQAISEASRLEDYVSVILKRISF